MNFNALLAEVDRETCQRTQVLTCRISLCSGMKWHREEAGKMVSQYAGAAAEEVLHIGLNFIDSSLCVYS
jgi:hypothetical protein